MKDRRWMSLLTALVLAAGMLCGCGGQTPAPDASPNLPQQAASDQRAAEAIDGLELPDRWKQELHHAARLGLPMDRVGQEHISGKEMMELLDWFVSYAAPEKAEDWGAQLKALRGSRADLARFDAMAALFLAAEQVGGSYAGPRYGVMEISEGINHSWEKDYVSWELFGGFDAYGRFPCGDMGENYLDGAAYYYNLGRASSCSEEYPFALDPATNSFGFDTPLTYAEGLLAVVRLISSANPELFAWEPAAQEAEYLRMADQKRAEIRGAVTDCAAQASGRVYYVSPQGSDQNDGRSPETAWATPQHALSQRLQPGDAVLLERGGSWQIAPSDRQGLTSSALTVGTGVTLGAYGTGEKPVLRGDLAQANSPDFWELYEERDGARIWKAAQPVYYCPVIVLDGDGAYAEPVLPAMDAGGRWLNEDGEAFDAAAGLKRDLQFCCLPDLTQQGAAADLENAALTGTLFLRCDGGNPAALYESIAVPQAACGLVLQTDAAITDISLFGFTCNGAVLDGYDGFHAQRVTNCEVGWCGGLLKGYEEERDGVFRPTAAGGALQISSSGVQVTNSYLHHCGPFGLIAAIHNNAENPAACILHFKDVRIADNLMEYCGSGVHMGDYADMDLPGTKGYLTNFVFENNIVMNSGKGWVYSLIGQENGWSVAALSAFETNDSAIDNDGIFIRGNLFYKSAFALFSLSDYHLDQTTRVNALPVFTDNTYVQTAHKPLLQKNRSSEVFYPSEQTVRTVLGDPTGQLVAVGR